MWDNDYHEIARNFPERARLILLRMFNFRKKFLWCCGYHAKFVGRSGKCQITKKERGKSTDQFRQVGKSVTADW